MDFSRPRVKVARVHRRREAEYCRPYVPSSKERLIVNATSCPLPRPLRSGEGNVVQWNVLDRRKVTAGRNGQTDILYENQRQSLTGSNKVDSSCEVLGLSEQVTCWERFSRVCLAVRGGYCQTLREYCQQAHGRHWSLSLRAHSVDMQFTLTRHPRIGID